MIKPACSVSFLLSIDIVVWQNVLYFLDAPRSFRIGIKFRCVVLPKFVLITRYDPGDQKRHGREGNSIQNFI